MRRATGHDTAGAEPRRPSNPRLLLLVVGLTIGSVALLMVSGLVIARELGIAPEELQGAGFAVRPETITVFLVFQLLQIAIVVVAHRLIHRRPLRDLGFGPPVVRYLGIGFALGVALAGARVLWGVVLLLALPGGDVGLEWSVPQGTPFVAIVSHYLFFFLVFLTANSFGEEMVFRCYPVEQFRDDPRMLLWAVGVATMLFAAIHFIIGTFSIEWLIGLVGFAAIATYIYYRWRSVWLIVGLHSGASFVSFSLAGNWRMGGLVRLVPTVPEASPWVGVLFLTVDVALFALALWLVARLGRRLPAAPVVAE